MMWHIVAFIATFSMLKQNTYTYYFSDTLSVKR